VTITTVELTQALIRCRSVTPDDNGALDVLSDVLRDAGFDVHLPVFSAPDTPDIRNLYARIGTGAPIFVFAGHTDVVPPGDEASWTAGAFSGEVRDGVLYGRGAVDMKGGVAAMTVAALRHIEKHGLENGSIAFLITGDEEGPAINGMVKLLEWAAERQERFDHCVLGEPSSTSELGDEVKIGRRGSQSGTLVVHGKQGHVAYPHKADNPIRRMLPILDTLLAPLDDGTAHFERSNLELTSVDVGNPTPNVIPAKATISFNVRFNDTYTLDTLKTLLSERVKQAAGPTRYELSFATRAASSFITEPGDFIQIIGDSVEAETGRRPRLATGGGTSDARFIKDYCPVVEVGMTNATMHQVDERVSVAELDAVTRVYEQILARYFAS
jgi:succinyl-diaminopimelate desuccinylase